MRKYLLNFLFSFKYFLLDWGFDSKVFIGRLKLLMKNWIRKDFNNLRKQMGRDNLFRIGKNYFIWQDKSLKSGVMEGHYFHQDLYVAQKIFLNNPLKHLDIGSRIDGFVAHVATFRKIEIIDIRYQTSSVKNINFKQLDFMDENSIPSNYCDSVSSLHAIEHFGLGRYGDPIDYYGHIKALKNISKILKPNGKFYFSVPIGPQRIEFNAHRVFSIDYLLEILNQIEFEVKEVSYVNDEGLFFENIDLKVETFKSNFGCVYGCGIFFCEKI